MSVVIHRAALTLALAASVVIPSATVRAQGAAEDDGEGGTEAERNARHHFRLGEAHYASGAFLDAAHEFEEAYRLSNRTVLLYNIFVAYRDAGHLAPAADALRRYVELAPDADNAEMARQRLRAIERRLAAQEAGEAPPEEEAPAEGDEGLAADTSGSAASPGSAGSSDATAPPASTGGGGLSPVGFIVAGVGAAALVGAAVTGGLALSEQDALQADCPNRACPDGYDFESRVSSGQTLAITTDVLLGVGLAALATGVVLIFVLDDGGGEDTQVGALCGPQGCAVSARGRF